MCQVSRFRDSHVVIDANEIRFSVVPSRCMSEASCVYEQSRVECHVPGLGNAREKSLLEAEQKILMVLVLGRAELFARRAMKGLFPPWVRLNGMTGKGAILLQPVPFFSSAHIGIRFLHGERPICARSGRHYCLF